MRLCGVPSRRAAPPAPRCTVATTAAWPCTQGVQVAAAGSRPGRWPVMSAVTEPLEHGGRTTSPRPPPPAPRHPPLELPPHRQASTSTDTARALGIDAGEVLKTLAVRTGPGYVLVVVPASVRRER